MQRDAGFSAGRIDDLIARAQRTGIVQYTPFLDPLTAHEIKRICKSAALCCDAFGGYDEAERQMVAVGDDAAGKAFPIETLKISWEKRFGSPAHHDILGAVMALGIKRETFGDILVGDDAAYIFVSRAMKDTILLLTSAGRVNVHTEVCDLADIQKPSGKTITATFKSFRLDAVIAEGMKLPRTGAAQLIAQGKVLLNFAPCLKADAHLATGDVISIRGIGRIVVGEEGGKSKKDRNYLTFEVFSRR